MVVSAETYERVALEDPDGLWELVCGELRQKSPMTFEHDHVIEMLADRLRALVSSEQISVRAHPIRLLTPSGAHYIPDLCLIPRELLRTRLEEKRRELSVLAESLPLVVEVWSPSIGRHDREVKLAEYRARGDAEIWLIHPREQSRISWRRTAHGHYRETRYAGGMVPLAGFPGVFLDLDALFRCV